jgi:hypothetical protein
MDTLSAGVKRFVRDEKAVLIQLGKENMARIKEYSMNSNRPFR